MTVIAAVRGRLMGESSFSNELDNSLYDMNNYPVWTTYNGYQPSNDASYINQTGAWKTFAYWRHYSPLYNDGYGSYIGNQLLDRVSNHNGNIVQRTEHPLLPFLSGSEPRVLKIFGAESLFTANASSGPPNNNADRGNGTTGEFTNQNSTRVIGNTGNSQSGNYITGSIGTGTNMYNTSLWTRYDWTQIVDIPDSATTVTFGAQIQVGEYDKLKSFNFAGIYCAEDNYTTNTRVVNYFRVRANSAPYVLATGTLSSSASPYNWSGLTTSGATDGSNNLKIFTPASTVANELAVLNQNDYEEFKKVEYSFTPQSGTSRKMSFNLFFAESAFYLATAAGNPTGGFQIFDPYVEFS
jgi:hypothetical protein